MAPASLAFCAAGSLSSRELLGARALSRLLPCFTGIHVRPLPARRTRRACVANRCTAASLEATHMETTSAPAVKPNTGTNEYTDPVRETVDDPTVPRTPRVLLLHLGGTLG
jgi:hypothetical protein